MINNGFTLGLITLSFVFFLETTNINTIKQIIHKQGLTHYLHAWAATTLNSVILGPVVYKFVEYIYIDELKHSLLTNVLNINFILILHSIGYFSAHNVMHTKYLWFAHKFHHTFSLNVSPVVAMAVSPAEYGIAYMLPFVIASLFVKPNNNELVISAGIVSFCNIIIHCPSIRFISMYYPNWWVSPEKHLLHHSNKKSKHIAASTFDLDYILNS